MCKIHTEVSLEETNCCMWRESGESQRSLLLNKDELNASNMLSSMCQYHTETTSCLSEPEGQLLSSHRAAQPKCERYFLGSSFTSDDLKDLVLWLPGALEIMIYMMASSSWSCLSASHGQRLPTCLYIVVSVTFPSSPRNKHGGLKSHCCKSRIFWPWVNNKHVAS